MNFWSWIQSLTVKTRSLWVYKSIKSTRCKKKSSPQSIAKHNKITNFHMIFALGSSRFNQTKFRFQTCHLLLFSYVYIISENLCRTKTYLSRFDFFFFWSHWIHWKILIRQNFFAINTNFTFFFFFLFHKYVHIWPYIVNKFRLRNTTRIKDVSWGYSRFPLRYKSRHESLFASGGEGQAMDVHPPPLSNFHKILDPPLNQVQLYL